MNADDEAERLAGLHPMAGMRTRTQSVEWQPEHASPRRPPVERMHGALIDRQVELDLAAMDSDAGGTITGDSVYLIIAPMHQLTPDDFDQYVRNLLAKADASMKKAKAKKRWWRESSTPMHSTYATKRHHKGKAWLQGEQQRREAKR